MKVSCGHWTELTLVIIDHFTVVTWPLNGSEAVIDLVLIQTSLQVVLILTSWHLND